MAYDPNVLRSMISPPPAFGGGQPGGAPTHGAPGGAAGATGAQQPPTAEPVALHDAAVKAAEAITAARSALEDLSAQAEMAESIDPSIEKTITTANDSLGEIDDSMADIVSGLLGAREDHEAMASDSGGDAGGPPKK